MPEHSFDILIAKEYGILEAVLLKHLYFWIKKNEVNNVHMHDNNCWTYNSVKAFQELFPYATVKQIRTALEHLVSEELIVTGNYNTFSFDRTLWYALTEKGKSIVLKSQTHLPEKENAPAQEGKPIPDIISTDIISTDNNDCISNEIQSKAKHNSARFTPPTLEEIQAYCKERNSSVNPQQFYEYFTAGNWTDSKGQKVKNWKQKLLTWEKYNQGTTQRVGANGVKLSATHDNTLDGIL